MSATGGMGCVGSGDLGCGGGKVIKWLYWNKEMVTTINADLKSTSTEFCSIPFVGDGVIDYLLILDLAPQLLF